MLYDTIIALRFELITLGSALMLLLFGIFCVNKEKSDYIVGTVCSVAFCGALFAAFNLTDIRDTVVIMEGHYTSDPMATIVKLLILICSFVVFILTGRFASATASRQGNLEFCFMVLLYLTGLYLAVSANNFIMLYVGLELAAISSYVILTLKRESDNTSSLEAPIKYLILGMLSSGIFLYGVSLIYSCLGTTDFTLLSQRITALSPGSVMIGVVMVTVSILMRLGVGPFHYWVPDVYANVTTLLVLFFATVPKFAYVSVIMRLISSAFIGLDMRMCAIFRIVAPISMLIGAMGALRQMNIRRFLGFAAVNQMGYVLFALSAPTLEGEWIFGSVIGYLLVYSITMFAVFIFISLCAEAKGTSVNALSLCDLKSFASLNPVYALLVMFALLSLASVPPTAGFFTKYYALRSAMTIIDLPLFAMLTVSIVSLYYYLSLVKRMYIDDYDEIIPYKISLGIDIGPVIMCCCVLAVVLFVFFAVRYFAFFNSIFSFA